MAWSGTPGTDGADRSMWRPPRRVPAHGGATWPFHPSTRPSVPVPSLPKECEICPCPSRSKRLTTAEQVHCFFYIVIYSARCVAAVGWGQRGQCGARPYRQGACAKIGNPTRAGMGRYAKSASTSHVNVNEVAAGKAPPHNPTRPRRTRRDGPPALVSHNPTLPLPLRSQLTVDDLAVDPAVGAQILAQRSDVMNIGKATADGLRLVERNRVLLLCDVSLGIPPGSPWP